MRRAALAAALALVALTGCEDDVETTLGIDVPFSLYGYLDPTADRQLVRVVGIDATIDAEVTATEATVTSTDLQTGETTTWRDSLVTFDDGSQGSVYLADITPRPGSQVRLEAARADGATSTVTIDVPALAPARVGLPVFGLGEVTYPILFEGAPRMLSGQLELVVDNVDGVEGAPQTLAIPLRVQPREVEPGVWAVDIPFLTAVSAALTDLGLAGTGVTLTQAVYTGFAANAAWTVPTSDPDALVEPGTFSNVDRGLGFVGAGYFTSATWLPEPTVLLSAGFDADRRPASYVRVNEVKVGGDSWIELYNPLLLDATMTGYSLSNAEGAPDLFILPEGTVVPGSGFLVVRPPFDVRGQDTVVLYTPNDEPVQRFFVGLPALLEDDRFTFGSWPDGRSKRFRSLFFNGEIFMGSLVPTPEAPNELPGRPVRLNELYTEGADGWAEAVLDPGFDASRVTFLDDRVEYVEAWGQPVQGALFAVADEGTWFGLPQLGGEVYVVAEYTSRTAGQPGGHRVVDARTYGPQTPGRSAGYLPDAPDGVWTPNLAPTRGAPNAAARLGL